MKKAASPQPDEKKTAKTQKTLVTKRQSPEPVQALPVPATEKKEHVDSNTPVVGIGASAGGLAAFESFFSGMPAEVDPGMAFVLVQHLAPDHKSMLTELVKRCTRMDVFEVTDNMAVNPNCIYIIPPDYDMSYEQGALHLKKRSPDHGLHLPVDYLFNSLALELHEKATGIVLSGTGSDGTLGIQAIKAGGGMVMAQNPDSGEYNGMPSSAIATGLVDFVLSPVDMPRELIAYVKRSYAKLPLSTVIHSQAKENALKLIFTLLFNQTGHDFSKYKENTVQRRIEHRMAVRRIEKWDDYVALLKENSSEVDTLFHDLLIGVTNFFRDPEAFEALEKLVIPDLFAGKPAGATVRVWTPGCCRGEEAYSIAILLQEYMEAKNQFLKVQIFATDIDVRSLSSARTGIYSNSLASDVSPERLARFFTVEPDSNAYRISKKIRDMILFSEQDVIKDPPFSKVDLITCRNLMIYFNAELQKRLIPIFHYALNPSGYIFLGISETAAGWDDLFVPRDRKLKIYKRKEILKIPRHANLRRFGPNDPPSEFIPQKSIAKSSQPGRIPLRELTEQALLAQVSIAGVLVTAQGDILYLHGRTGMYLEPAPGESGTNNILKMAREGLERELTIALHKASVAKEIVYSPGLRVKTNGHYTLVNLTVRPVLSGITATLETPLFLVVLEDAPVNSGKQSATAKQPPAYLKLLGNNDKEASAEARIAELELELKAKEEFLQTSNEELETSNEELKSSNEEMQSAYEELQSTNEELETSKEELQSLNEELATVNTELQTNVTDLSRMNNDMNNLLSGTGIGTIFVDHQMCILRFTPPVTKIINLIQSDVGRPVGHIVSNLVGSDHFIAATQAVLDTLVPTELNVQTNEGKWFTMRIQPYRTLENVIEGAVISFIDITDTKLAEVALGVSESRYRRLFETAKSGILILEAETGKITNVNPFLTEMLGYNDSQFVGKAIWDIGLFKDVAANQDHFLKLQQKEYIRYEDLPLETADGRKIDVEFISNVYLENDHKVIQCDIRDITDRKIAEGKVKNLLEEKEIVLQEVHHRIKNNMNTICGLLSLQAETLSEPVAIAALQDSRSRVQSMMVLYEKLYRSTSYDVLPVCGYLSALVDEIIANFPNHEVATVKKNIGEFDLDVATLQPLGLILNELLTNVMKYAFKGRKSGVVTVSAFLHEKTVTLEVADDGVGIPDSIDFGKSNGFGFMLISLLSKQLQGSLRLERGNGTRVILDFEKPE